MNSEALHHALADMRQALGDDAVVYDNKTHLGSYRDSYTPVDLDDYVPAAAVAPRNVKQVQQVVDIARKHQTPLWTVSTGRNYGYGGAAPRKSGCIVVDLKRMNRIIEVNEKHAYAIVEPGVSYYELYEYIQKRGLKLWIDCAAPAWGGVLGNCADRGVGYTPFGEHFLAQCSMQVVLADGTVVETAMGASDNALAKYHYKYGHGAWVDGLFTQSNFGIITQLGMWLMPEPPGYRPYLVTFPKEEDIAPITDVVQPLKLNMVIPNAATTVGLIWEAAVKVTKAQYYSGTGVMPESARRQMASDLEIGNWNFYAALYGPDPIMDVNWEIIQDSFSAIPGAKFFTAEQRQGDAAFDYRAKLMQGIPNMTEFGLLNWVGAGSHIDFSPMSPVTGSGALKQFKVIRDVCHQYDFDYIGEFLVGWRDMHHVLMLVFERDNEAHKKTVRELFLALIEESTKEGYGEYRTHLHYMDNIAKTYNWNDRALYKSIEALKDAFDPSGILSPGKSGIWPQAMRGKKT